MPKSFCAYRWKFKHNLSIIHVCLLAPNHEGEHYCGKWHDKNGVGYKCASSQFREKTRK